MPPYTEASSYFPRPGKVVTTVMVSIAAVWLAFAVGLHWGGVPRDVFLLATGNSLHILHGEVWRLLTAAILQDPDGIWPLLSAELMLYFFATPLESQWGSKRLARFLITLAIVSSVVQVFVEVALPPSVAHALVPPFWFGGYAVVDGLVIAWALNNRGSVIRVYGILPVTAGMMILFTLAWPLVYLIMHNVPQAGIPAMYGSSLTGWLVGGGTPSPLRRYWLKFRMGRLGAEVARENARDAAQRKKRVERSGLKVIEGGRAKSEPNASEKGRGPDGRWLN